LFGILIADYYLIRKQVVKVADLYTMSRRGVLVPATAKPQGHLGPGACGGDSDAVRAGPGVARRGQLQLVRRPWHSAWCSMSC